MSIIKLTKTYDKRERKINSSSMQGGHLFCKVEQQTENVLNKKRRVAESQSKTFTIVELLLSGKRKKKRSKKFYKRAKKSTDLHRLSRAEIQGLEKTNFKTQEVFRTVPCVILRASRCRHDLIVLIF